MSPDVKRIKVLNNSKTFSATQENRSPEIFFRRELVIKIAAFSPVDPFVHIAGDEEMSRILLQWFDGKRVCSLANTV